MSVYFSQRGITRPADDRLSELGFGRAHHRTLTFIGVQPGCTVQELAKTLRIANQNLNRVLSPLVKQGYVEQRHDPKDLRFRRLYLTEQGRELEEHGFQAQFERLDEVMRQSDRATLQAYLDFTRLMMDAEDRAFLDAVSGSGEPADD
ncbi:MarR family winged helix-turn-helix transcriptional regulator [Pseudodonghicola flavimaris]|uniref:MarR family transcriptional regulator n=1 Tax=Pseudodonghicola flavimaris TaxID=3050036 RepID=A0ABT7F200_9RHOB|nr:MarR family transcriptional regulator [Pseudodonghicola flavimaris]MDK3018634.1 MarR family transcriptional regulator [Pseudodonghicola flavimaris]